MNRPWHSFKNLQYSAEEGITAKVELPEESSWFNGHFPDFPLLPGIAQVGMIIEAIQKIAADKGTVLKLSSIKRLRFRKIIQPNDAIELAALPSEDNSFQYSFRITVNGELACNGTLLTEEITVK